MATDEEKSIDMQAWRNELWMLKLWHPLYGQGSQKRSVLDDALDELAALRAWKERAVPLLTELVDRQTIHDAGYTWCLICYTNVAASNDYTASCAAHKARALLAESEVQ